MDEPLIPIGKKLLCIEDEFFISELYTRALKKAGYDVTVESDGAKALQLAMSNDFDIILLDILVPNIIGLDILRRLRAEAPELRAKIVITTNLDQGQKEKAEVAALVDGYIIKAEVTPRQLVEFLSHL